MEVKKTYLVWYCGSNANLYLLKDGTYRIQFYSKTYDDLSIIKTSKENALQLIEDSK